MCAIECGRRGRSVLVLDHAERTGSKIRISGGGRCNFTNLHAAADHYFSNNPHFCRSALARFTPRDILSLVEQHHIAYYEKEAGQMFCVKSARDIIGLLERECGRAGAEIRLACSITDIQHPDHFVVTTNNDMFHAGSLVIATGGLSYPKLGASEFGFNAARQFGIKVLRSRPALVPFLFPGREQKFVQELAGISLETAITCSGKRFQGSTLFTHRGLSGPAALQASLVWLPGSALEIDLLPGTDTRALFSAKRRARMEMRNLLSNHLPRRFAQAWCEHWGWLKPIDQTPDAELIRIAEGLHAWTIVPKATEGYDIAEVTAGGVDTDELSSKTMEAKKVPGLYFVGEVVDVTGELGGYNLHWAWASGFAAGQYA